MRILIVGAGGLGGYFGAWLLSAGRDVTFLVRPQRARQLRTHGLKLQSEAGNLKLPPPSTVLADAMEQTYDLILLSAKAYDLASAMEDVAPAVGPETLILPLLNGMAHMDALDARFGRERVLGGLTTVSAGRDDEGRILHLNQLDALLFGDRDQPESERGRRVLEALRVPGYTASLRTNIPHDMWQKWVSISAAAGVTCLMRATVGDIVAAGAGHLVHQLIAETNSIATAEGFPAKQPFLDTAIAKFTEAGSPFTASMLRDIESGGPIEAQQIVGDLLERGRHHGLQTPLLEVVAAHLRCYEERRKRESLQPLSSS